jgi:hypothetical protein
MVEANRRHNPPTFLHSEPMAVLSRPVITPGLDFMRFVEQAKQSKLRPLCLEYTRDKFVSKNPDKHMLGMMRFVQAESSRRLRVVDFGTMDGLPLDEVKCKNDQRLVDFHHQLLAHVSPDIVPTDFSSWFRTASRGEFYYLEFLSLFITSGILFENFLLHDTEERYFAETRIFPSFNRVVEMYGVKPLIVRLFTPKEEREPTLWLYPGGLYPIARDNLRGLSQPRCSEGILLRTDDES